MCSPWGNRAPQIRAWQDRAERLADERDRRLFDRALRQEASRYAYRDEHLDGESFAGETAAHTIEADDRVKLPSGEVITGAEYHRRAAFARNEDLAEEGVALQGSWRFADGRDDRF